MRSLRLTTALLLASALPVGTQAQDAARGEQLAQRVLRAYPFATPDIRGAATSSPLATLYVPTAFWNRLSRREQRDLAAYMPKLTNRMRMNPGRYMGVPSSAPFYPRAIANVGHMSNESWQIIIGAVEGKGRARTMLADRAVVCGRSAPECDGQYADQFLGSHPSR